MSEVYQAYAYVSAMMKADSALVAAATGGIWQGFAPIGTALPYALVTKQSDHDVLTLNANRVMSHMLLQIKAVGSTSDYDTLEIIANRIDALFGKQDASTPPTGGIVLGTYRESQISYEEAPAPGVQISHLGGLYDIDLQGT